MLLGYAALTQQNLMAAVVGTSELGKKQNPDQALRTLIRYCMENLSVESASELLQGTLHLMKLQYMTSHATVVARVG